MARRTLPLALIGLASLMSLAAPAGAAPSAAAQLAQARAELGHASTRLAQARSLGDRAAEAGAAAAKARLVRREAELVPLAAAERAAARLRARLARERRAAVEAAAQAAQAAAALGPATEAASPYAPYTALAASAGPPPPAATLVPLLDGYLASRQSPLTGLAAAFVAEGSAAGVDPRFLVAIAGAETSFGVYGPSQAIRNPFGLGPGMSFGSWEESIRYAARNLAGPLYAGDGRFTVPAIQARWAPNGAANDPTGLNSHWTRNVGVYLAELGGDASAAVIGLPPPAVSAVSAAERAPAEGAGPVAAPAAAGPRRLAEVPPGGARPPAARVAAEAALGFAGTPYALGGTDARGLDGPGLVRASWARARVALPGSVAALAAVGTPVAPADVRPGDAVLLDGGRLGVYLGAGRFAWVPGDGTPVTVASFRDPVVAPLYRGARRFSAPATPLP